MGLSLVLGPPISARHGVITTAPAAATVLVDSSPLFKDGKYLITASVSSDEANDFEIVRRDKANANDLDRHVIFGVQLISDDLLVWFEAQQGERIVVRNIGIGASGKRYQASIYVFNAPATT